MYDLYDKGQRVEQDLFFVILSSEIKHKRETSFSWLYRIVIVVCDF